MMAYYVNSTALDWALANLERRGANDLLPKSPFIAALRGNWPSVRSQLANIDLATHKPASPRMVYVPKHATAFRVSHDLDLVDHLLFSAFVYEIGDTLEGSRDGYANERVYSCRFAPESNGSLFRPNTYEAFRSRNLFLANEEGFDYVVALDLTDCYNQISTHRVQNALVEAGLSL